MPEPIEIESSLLKTNKIYLFTLGLMIFMFSGILSSVMLSREWKSVSIVFIGVILFFVLPLLLVNKTLNAFSKTARIKLTNDFLEMNVFNKTTFNLEEQHKYCYYDIKSFKMIASETNKSSYLKLLLNNGTKIKYSFLGQANSEQNVLQNVLIFFTSYNEGKSADEKITILPTFYTTKTGRYCIIGMLILIVIVVLLHIIYKPQSSFISVFTSILLYFRIKSQQKSDLEIYKNFK